MNKKLEIEYHSDYNWILEDHGDNITVVLFHHETNEQMGRLDVNLADREENNFATKHWNDGKKTIFLMYYRGKSIGFNVENFVGFVPDASQVALEGIDHGEFIVVDNNEMKKRFAWNFLRSILEASNTSLELRQIRVAFYLDTAFLLDSNFTYRKPIYDKVLTHYEHGEGMDQTNSLWFVDQFDEQLIIGFVDLFDPEKNSYIQVPLGEQTVVKTRISVDGTILFRVQFAGNAVTTNCSNFLGICNNEVSPVAMSWHGVEDFPEGPVKVLLDAFEVIDTDGTKQVVDKVRTFCNSLPVYNGMSGMTFKYKDRVVH